MSADEDNLKEIGSVSRSSCVEPQTDGGFFCDNCSVLALNKIEVMDHIDITGHEHYWASRSDEHIIYCVKCNAEFSSLTDSKKHVHKINDVGHTVFLRKKQPPKQEAGDKTPQVQRSEETEMAGPRVLKKTKKHETISSKQLFSNSDPECSDDGELSHNQYDQGNEFEEDDEYDDCDAIASSEEHDELIKFSSDLDIQLENADSDDSLYDDEIRLFAELVQLRNLKNLKLEAKDRKMLREKYIIAEGVTSKVAIRKVTAAIEKYREKGYFEIYRKGSNKKHGESSEEKAKKEDGEGGEEKAKKEDDEGGEEKAKKQEDEPFVFDHLLRQLCLKKLGKRKCIGAKAKRMNTVLEIMLELLKAGNVDMRENMLHYMYPELLQEPNLKDNQLSNRVREAVLEISMMLKVPRESLNLRASPKGLVCGSLKCYVDEMLLADCSLGGTSGCLIPAEADQITKIEATEKITYVLVVEKDTVFHHLIRMGFHKKERCVLVTGKGQPCLASRNFLRKVSDSLPGVRFFGLVDYNPSGMQIFCTYWIGSEKRAHESILLTLPNIELIGFCMDDVNKEDRRPLTDRDTTMLNNFLGRSYLEQTSTGNCIRQCLTDMRWKKSKADLDVLLKRNKLVDLITEKTRVALKESSRSETNRDDLAYDLANLNLQDAR